ncbi:MAG: mechanosensitive ion channel family protein [Xanthomonadales bacterium]|nr:mechanosensitive ion channel family protein [Xanthomonadales bacterium]
MEDWMLDYLPLLIATPLVVAVLWAAHWALLGRRRSTLGAEARLPRQIALLVLTIAALVLLILLLPMAGETRSEVLKLLGVALTAVVALSSTTFIANAMAGVMLRVVGSFRPGDFISVEDRFGRISERGLFHTEIQTEDRDLVTLPNLFLATHPIKVVRSSGTMITASLSLGYDVSHRRIERLLKQAAEAVDLQEPFVQVMELGDFSVTYKVSAFLEDVKQIISARSNLRRSVLDTLHGDGVEIVSPTFMNQRQLDPGRPVIPKHDRGPDAEVMKAADADSPEQRVFDKAEEAESLDALNQRIDDLENDYEAACKEHGKDSEQAASLRQSMDKAVAERDALKQRREEERRAERERRNGKADTDAEGGQADDAE